MISDVIIARLDFPNDPTNTLIAHQMLVAEDADDHIDIYSISSIPGKERRVYGPEKDNYATILAPEFQQNGFKLPSFIDCTSMYEVAISSNCDLTSLAQRNIDPKIKKRILDKIADMKTQGKHTIYNISEEDFIKWNPRVSKSEQPES